MQQTAQGRELTTRPLEPLASALVNIHSHISPVELIRLVLIMDLMALVGHMDAVAVAVIQVVIATVPLSRKSRPRKVNPTSPKILRLVKNPKVLSRAHAIPLVDAEAVDVPTDPAVVDTALRHHFHMPMPLHSICPA